MDIIGEARALPFVQSTLHKVPMALLDRKILQSRFHKFIASVLSVSIQKEFGILFRRSFIFLSVRIRKTTKPSCRPKM
jgi:hypothetical protein